MMSDKIKLAPSILSVDFAHLGEQIVAAAKAGADYIHIDVMDGQFVPKITIGDGVVKAIRPHTTLPLDVHLMVNSPERQIESFAQAGADIITVHVEACTHLHCVVLDRNLLFAVQLINLTLFSKIKRFFAAQ